MDNTFELLGLNQQTPGRTTVFGQDKVPGLQEKDGCEYHSKVWGKCKSTSCKLLNWSFQTALQQDCHLVTPSHPHF
jgi:hypothetical protein